MERLRWLQWLGVVCFATAVTYGTELISLRRLQDHHVGMGPSIYLLGHPYIARAILVLILGTSVSALCWVAGRSRASGLTLTGWPLPIEEPADRNESLRG